MLSSASQRIRWVLAAVVSVLAICLATLTVVLVWFQYSVADEDHFVASTTSIVHDEQFRSDLADDVTRDVMDSDQVTRYLGSGSGSGPFGGIQNWAKNGVTSLVHSTVEGVIASQDFQKAWTSTATATHSANFGDSPESTMVVDAAPMYQAFGDKLGSAIPVDPELDGSSHLLSLENAPDNGKDAPIAAFLHGAQSLSDASPAFGAGGVVLALLAGLIAPRAKSLFVALAAAGTGILTWLVMTVLSARFGAQMSSLQGTEGLFASRFADAITANVQTWALTSLGVGLGLSVVLVIGHVLSTSRRGASSHRF